MKQNKVLILVALICICFVAGCNLFSFTNPTDSSTDYIAEGQKKYWDKDYGGAVEDFASAIEADPDNGCAYWWHAKAILRTTGVTSISLVTDLSDLDIDLYHEPVPFFDEVKWPATRADKLYQALLSINEELEMLHDSTVVCEELDADAVALDYAAGLSLQGVFSLRDTNGDGVIGEGDILFDAYFSNGEFEIPESEWDDLSDDEKNDLIDLCIDLLNTFRDIATTTLEGVEGIDINDLVEVVDEIIEELENLRP